MKMKTLKQAQYQAKREAICEFKKQMSNKNASGHVAQRFDSAERSARLVYDGKLRDDGFDPISSRVNFRFLQNGNFVVDPD
jgi:hypothetical protein